MEKGKRSESGKSVNKESAESKKMKSSIGKYSRISSEKEVEGKRKKIEENYLSGSSQEKAPAKKRSLQKVKERDVDDYINEAEEANHEEKANIEESKEDPNELEDNEKFIDEEVEDEESDKLDNAQTPRDRENYEQIKRLLNAQKKQSTSKSHDSDSDSLIVDKVDNAKNIAVSYTHLTLPTICSV
eukprot:TRINITY_DN5268_c0_g1_i1.p1 TRINITY_DN5268_c0_g1~~TRINITY_DN5268_c0_g1_i1.p1  ORF type:complete len:186 (+),score=56.97 TRINITY_DN5268_c0_g1_i1:451-1008(+)